MSTPRNERPAEQLTVEDIARTTDDAVTSARFDRRNLFWLRFLLGAFLIVGMIEMLAAVEVNGTQRGVIVAVTTLIFNALMVLLMLDARRLDQPARRRRYFRITRLFRAHVSGVVIAWAVVQFTLLFAYVNERDAWIAWAVVFPLTLIALRMQSAEILLMHGYFLAVTIVRALVSGGTLGEFVATAVAATGVNAIAVAIELLSSRGMRKQVVDEWSDRRLHAREQMRMRDELRYAREIQLSMLPADAPHLDWIDVAGVSLPATEVGGDWFDYFITGDRLAIASIDVAGHGLASGLVLSAMRTGFTLLRDELAHPAAVLQRLHELVIETSRKRMLVTASVLLLDRTNQRALFASAAHPPLVVRSGDTTRTITLPAPPLGVRLPLRVPQTQLPLASGDVFVVHTDGIYEARNRDGEVYGLERLEAIVAAQLHDASASEIRDAITRDVEAFRAGEPQDDDVTVVVAKMR